MTQHDETISRFLYGQIVSAMLENLSFGHNTGTQDTEDITQDVMVSLVSSIVQSSVPILRDPKDFSGYASICRDMFI